MPDPEQGIGGGDEVDSVAEGPKKRPEFRHGFTPRRVPEQGGREPRRSGARRGQVANCRCRESIRVRRDQESGQHVITGRRQATTAADQASRGDLGLPLFGQSGGHRRVDVRTAALGHQCGGVAHGRRTRAGEARNHGWHDAAHAGRQLTYGNGAVTDHRDTPHRVQRSLVAVRWHDESARQSDRVLGEEGDDVTGCLEVDR